MLPSLVLFAFVAGFTPGPNNIMIMVSGLNYGIRPSMPHFFGICFGFPVMFLVLGFGLGYVFDLYPVLHNLIKVVGVVYILYLSWLIAVTKDSDLNGQDARPLTFFQGALFQWVNPKAWGRAL